MDSGAFAAGTETDFITSGRKFDCDMAVYPSALRPSVGFRLVRRSKGLLQLRADAAVAPVEGV